MTTGQHRQASEQRLEQARAEFAAGDIAQAPEKGWRASAQMLKAIAEQRGWGHSRHRHHLVAVSRLRIVSIRMRRVATPRLLFRVLAESGRSGR